MVFATEIGFLNVSSILVNEKWIATMSKGRAPSAPSYPTMLIALFLCVAQVPSARADSASCIAKVSSYVTELDELLSKERNWITPFDDLNDRYFPFRDCEADALLEVVRRSSFIRSISYHSRTEEYLIHFSSEEVIVGFGYLVSGKKSSFKTALWVHK